MGLRICVACLRRWARYHIPAARATDINRAPMLQRTMSVAALIVGVGETFDDEGGIDCVVGDGRFFEDEFALSSPFLV